MTAKVTGGMLSSLGTRHDTALSPYLQTLSSQHVRIGDFKVHHLHQGQGKPLILIHGGGMWLYTYRKNIPDLSRTFSVYALDMPGYGYTETCTGKPRYGIDIMADVLLGFMDAHDIEKASLVGHSWGGGWAIHFTHSHPDRVDKLVLIDSSGLDSRDILEWELLKYPLIGDFLIRCLSQKALKKRLERSFFHKDLVTPDMVSEIYTPLKFTANMKAQGFLARNQDWQKTEAAMPHIHQRVLLIWGDHDRYLDVKLAGRFTGLFPNIELVQVENCGHSAHEEYPKQVNGMITAFLNQDTGGVEGTTRFTRREQTCFCP